MLGRILPSLFFVNPLTKNQTYDLVFLTKELGSPMLSLTLICHSKVDIDLPFIVEEKSLKTP